MGIEVSYAHPAAPGANLIVAISLVEAARNGRRHHVRGDRAD